MTDPHNNSKHWETAAHVFQNASNLIKEGGWHQGEVGQTERWCLASAIEKAFDDINATIVDFFYVKELLFRQLSISDTELASKSGPDVPYWGEALARWNDSPGRGQAEVHNSLETAAASALQKVKKA